ncbi:MAG: 4-hydroxybenzoate polyprenyltransferase [Paracoccaceae bacterium]
MGTGEVFFFVSANNRGGESAQAGCKMNEKPILIVDLDFTLVKTDMLMESVWVVLTQNFATIFFIIGGLFSGRAQLKARLAARTEIDPALLPYNTPVLNLIRARREEGVRVALATAADEKIARSIADHLGLFDEVHASDGKQNNKGAAKARFLVEHYGAGKFDYIGDARADLPVWSASRQAITVDAPRSLRKAVGQISSDVRHIESGSRDRFSWLRAIRPYQWLKNVLIFVPAIAAHAAEAEIWLEAVLAFVAFSLVASSAYVLNDLLDLAADRAHPSKCRRPFASGATTLLLGTLMAPALLLAGLAIAIVIGRPEFLGVLIGYCGLTIAYSFLLKRKLVIDVCTLAGLYTLRILAGGMATGLPISVWLLIFSIFFFLSLASLKRVSELRDGVINNRQAGSGRAYLADDLPIVSMMALSSGYISVLVISLYIDSETVQRLYGAPSLLWGVCPILLYWVSRMAMMAHRGNIKDDPILYALRDWISLLCGAALCGVLLAGSIL